jgi:mono/diheme cytochrome c family protein
MIKKVVLYGAIAAVVLFGALQLVPYGRDHTNPPVVSEPKWDSPQTRALVKRACFDCHSYETVWLWYSHIAPGSWLIYKDVVDGREEFSFSNWAAEPKRARKLAEVVNEGQMPPPQYLLLHPEARLSPAEKQQLVAGFQKSVP